MVRRAHVNAGMGRNYSPELDGLRALCAFAVVAGHTLPDVVLGPGVRADVFFVLSGYLVTKSLARRIDQGGSIGDLQAFYARRLIRIAPLLLTVVAATTLLIAALAPHLLRPFVAHAVSAATFTSDFTAAGGLRGALHHTWTVAIEMKFYLLWPILLPFITRTGRPATVCMLIWFAITLARLAFGRTDADYYLPQFHSSGLMLGAALAFWRGARPPSWVGWVALVWLAAVSLIALPKAVAPLLAEAGAAVLLLNVPRLLGSPSFVWAGKRSYGTFLWHFPVMSFLGATGGPLALAVVYPTALAMGALTYNLIETPLSRTRTEHLPVAEDRVSLTARGPAE